MLVKTAIAVKGRECARCRVHKKEAILGRVLFRMLPFKYRLVCRYLTVRAMIGERFNSD